MSGETKATERVVQRLVGHKRGTDDADVSRR